MRRFRFGVVGSVLVAAILIGLFMALTASSSTNDPEPPADPKALKLGAIATLEGISTNDNGLQSSIDKAVREISRSISDDEREYFLDDSRILPPPQGAKVFKREDQATKHLQKRIDKNSTPQDIRETLQQAVDDLAGC